jgi:Tol biopolymer transport system component
MVAYRGAGGAERRQLKWFDRTGKALGVAGEQDTNYIQNPEFSPDERRLAIDRTVQNNADVWLMDLVRGGLTRFTSDAELDNSPVWSPDGAMIAFRSNRKHPLIRTLLSALGGDLYVKPSNGAGNEELLRESPNVKVPQDWSRDGRFLLYYEIDPKTFYDLYALPMTGERKPIVLANTQFQENMGQFSPDGRWVAYRSDESGRFEIYVRPFPEPSGKWQVSTAGGSQPRWGADGKELFFIAPDDKLMAVPVRTSGSTFDAGTPTMLFQTRIVANTNSSTKPQYAVSRDGRFLFNQPTEESTTSPITILQNWKPPAK